jgi:dihydrofolate reductase
MEKVLLGDNQFFAVSHLSDEKSRAQSIRFKDNSSIIRVIDQAIETGIKTFMCTTHDRIADICEHIRKNPAKYEGFKIYPCMPYAHKYANAVTELGIIGTIKQYVPGNIFSTFTKGGMAYLSKDFIKLIEIFIDAEMKMFRGVDTPVIFIQNVIVDLILGLKMFEIFREYDKYIRKKYNAEPGYITMNMPVLLDALNSIGIENPVICSSINKSGFRMSGGKEIYEKYLKEKKFRPIAMQVLAAGALRPKEAIEYLGNFPQIESVLFGASSKAHIQETKELIESIMK